MGASLLALAKSIYKLYLVGYCLFWMASVLYLVINELECFIIKKKMIKCACAVIHTLLFYLFWLKTSQEKFCQG